MALVPVGFAAGAFGQSGAPAEFVLRGRIMDTSDNWLPDVAVRLQVADVAAETDGNGLFEMRVVYPDGVTPGSDGAIDVLEVVKEGHQPRLIRVTDAAWFASPVEVKLTPNPVGTDVVGFTELVPGSWSLHGLVRNIEVEAPHAYSPEILRQQLDRVAARKRIADTEARFYAWIPEGDRPLRAVFLISLHGMGTVDHPVLRRFAEDESVALVGIDGQSVQRGFYPVAEIDPYLERLGELTGHPELATLPVFTFGHSNGTGFATMHPIDRPERVIGWISYHSGYAWQLLLPGVENAPGLVMHGHLDEWLENGQEQAVKDLRRLRNAPVAMMLEGNVGHGPIDPEGTWQFIVDFCKSLLRTRLNADGTLRPAVIEEGWLGGYYDRSAGGQQLLPIAPYAEFEGDRTTANWLPDEEFARIWQTYGTVKPQRRK